jgi:hypothetical protein
MITIDDIKLYLFDIFLTIKTLIKNLIWKIKTILYRINKIYYIKNNKKNNLYQKYIYYKCILFIKNIFNKIPKINNYTNTYFSNLLTKCNKQYNLVKVEVISKESKRDLFFVNKSFDYIVNRLDEVDFDINELLLHQNCIITDISLIYKNDEKTISIKQLIEHYPDRSKKYECHTLRNILEFKKIKYDDSVQLEIKYIKLPFGKKIKTYELKDKLDNHLSDLFNI